MQRTAGDRRRRRRLADASAGHTSGVTRASVVLYAPLGPEDDEPAIRAELRDYAEARDWATAYEMTDRGPLCSPIQARSSWPEMRRALLSGSAEGIVIARGLCPQSQDDESLRAWLADACVFLVPVHSCPHSRAAWRGVR